MITISEIEKMNRADKLDPKYNYYLSNIGSGYGVIYARPTSLLDRDALIMCRPLERCKELL